MKKILFISTIDQHIRHFHLPFLKWFKENGFETHVASNGNEKLSYVDKKINIPFSRMPFRSTNIVAYKRLKKIINNNNYAIIHCHTPVGGVIGRLAAIQARKKETHVLYTAHGFHFYEGAPKRNWLIFYPIEKILANFTDTLITINDEDYKIAKRKKFNSKKIKKVYGVGVDTSEFTPQTIELKETLRNKYKIKSDDFIAIYVGELSYRKNQLFLLKSFETISKKYSNAKLLLVGKGELKNDFKEYINSKNLQENVKLLGYRKDISNLMLLSDLVVSSSHQEGLPVNIMEAMSSGLPLLVSDSRGNRDLVENKRNGFVFNLNSYKEFIDYYTSLYINENLREKFGKESLKMVDKYSLDIILNEMEIIYMEALNENKRFKNAIQEK